MTLASEMGGVAARALGRCFECVEPVVPWQWQCSVQNGALLSVRASLSEGFLHLDCPLPSPLHSPFDSPAGAEPATEPGPGFIESALFRNASLPAGVGVALQSGNHLRLCADIAVLDEAQLLAAIRGAVEGFHHGLSASLSPHSGNSCLPSPIDPASAAEFAERIRESGWTFTERGPSGFSAPLDAASAPPATIALTGDGVFFAVEVARVSQHSQTSRHAIAAFLLATCAALRLVRPCASQTGECTLFSLQVSLSGLPAPDEIGHSLAALSIAWRLCARESALLLDEDAACCYLAAREFSFHPSTN